MPLSIRKILSNKPWLLVVLLLAAFLAAWFCFIQIALKNQPSQVPLEPLPAHNAAEVR
ncbi:MAG TPA: hypothetical protein PK490_03020 [Prosthecobacter sp.]|nr:hypothetical protein [Prosthecobacter sp.]HRK13230.1 hypothetical protein [Prosthecobacter sp.]